jgi:adenosylmethionine-8-amino-7-oxononanoate aminotransferase
MRVAADIIALAPPLIISRSDIDRLFEIVREVLKTID